MRRTRRQHDRRGSIYVLVLGASMLITVIGLTALLAVRVQHRTATASIDQASARLNAMAAIEMGTYWIIDDPDWRTNRPHGWWAVDTPVGAGAFSLQVVDPLDADLTNSPTDAIVMRGVGTVDDSRHLLEVRLESAVPDTTPPLDVVTMGLHSHLNQRIGIGRTLTVTGAPASSNGDIRVDGTLVGDVEAATQSGAGTHLGTSTVPAPAKDMPASTVIDAYIAMATAIPYSGDINTNVLAPGYNDYGGEVNAEGVYYLNTGGNDLVIEGSRIEGTLIVDAGLGKVKITNVAYLHPFRADYPVLLVRGRLVLDFTASGDGLREADWTKNFNPDGAKYLAVGDVDMADVYPSLIQGFVHCTGQLTVPDRPAAVTGAVLVEADVVIDGDLTINYDAEFLTTPPVGYTQDPLDFVQMQIVRGSWRQVVE